MQHLLEKFSLQGFRSIKQLDDLHPAAEAFLAALIRGASAQTQVLLSTRSATLVDRFKPSEVVVAEMHEGASVFHRLENEDLSDWLKRCTLGEAWRKNLFGGRPDAGTCPPSTTTSQRCSNSLDIHDH